MNVRFRLSPTTDILNFSYCLNKNYSFLYLSMMKELSMTAGWVVLYACGLLLKGSSLGLVF